MRQELLPLLECPRCKSPLGLSAGAEPLRSSGEEGAAEIRGAALVCGGDPPHEYPVRDGIVRFSTGLEHNVVQTELSYERSTYHGDARLTAPDFIAGFPETSTAVWPHTRHFGPDFRGLADELAIAPGSWVLDIGTAACWSSRILAQRGANVIALDIVDAPCYGLRSADIQFRAHGVYFERVLESMTALPFRDGVMDHVVFNASFHHTPDLGRTLSECWRALKPGGAAAMVNEEFTSVRHRFFPKAAISNEAGAHHDIRYREFEQAARKCGFRVRYRVARHVGESLRRRLPLGLGRGAVWAFEAFPVLLKQLNSALIILSKPGRRGG